jgi:hypothetical protein
MKKGNGMKRNMQIKKTSPDTTPSAEGLHTRQGQGVRHSQVKPMVNVDHILTGGSVLSLFKSVPDKFAFANIHFTDGINWVTTGSKSRYRAAQGRGE